MKNLGPDALTTDVAVLMVDTRAPSLAVSAAPPHVQYQSLSAWLNRRYARRHGYAFLYYQLQDENGRCRHVHWGERHPSYCKLPPLAAALERFSVVAFVDSDTWFAPSAPPLPKLLGQGHKHTHVHFASDHPFGNGPNCGFMVWRRSRATLALLRLWWNLDAGPHSLLHDYEQFTLYWAVAHLDAYRSDLRALRTLDRLQPLALDNGTPLAHADHTRRGQRIWRLAVAILASDTSIALPHVEEAAQLLQADAERDKPEVQALRDTILQAALVVIRRPKHRRGKRNRRWSRERSWHARKQQAAAIEDEQAAQTRVFARHINATAVAERLLKPSSFASNENSGSLGLPLGLPLALRPCMSSLRQWQLWRSPSIGRIELAAHPRLCLAAGPSAPLRAPKNGSLLAQLAACDGPASAAMLAQRRRKRISGSVGTGNAVRWLIWAHDLPGHAGSAQHVNLLSAIDANVDSSPRLSPPAATLRTHASKMAVLKQALLRFIEEHHKPRADITTVDLATPRRALLDAGNGQTPRSGIIPRMLRVRQTDSAAGAFEGKHGTWRRAHAVAGRLFAACNASVLGGARPDKPVQDCEAWCRPHLKPRHCRKCKCRACTGCIASDERTAQGSPFEAAAWDDGAADESNGGVIAEQTKLAQCLSVWQGDVGEVNGAPLVFGPCGQGAARQRQLRQRWTLSHPPHIAEAPSLFNMRSKTGLCVTAFPLHSGATVWTPPP